MRSRPGHSRAAQSRHAKALCVRGTLAAWAWGASRCLDYLQTDQAIAKHQVAIIGHSGRGGKTALWAGAKISRCALVCSNDSGRRRGPLRRKTKEKETLPVINRAFPHWFDENFKTYNGREAELPVDQHMLVAFVAPAMCGAQRRAGSVGGFDGEFLSVVHARPVFQLYGKEALGATPQMPAIDEPLDGDGESITSATANTT